MDDTQRQIQAALLDAGLTPNRVVKRLIHRLSGKADALDAIGRARAIAPTTSRLLLLLALYADEPDLPVPGAIEWGYTPSGERIQIGGKRQVLTHPAEAMNE